MKLENQVMLCHQAENTQRQSIIEDKTQICLWSSLMPQKPKAVVGTVETSCN